jgi:hypothetical protein
MRRSCSTHGRDDRCKKISMGKHEGRRSLGRHRRTWEGTVTARVRVWAGFNWIDIVMGRVLVKTIVCLRVV